MFKGMPKIFWVTTAMIYGWFFLFLAFELTVPGFPLFKFMGIPACFIYNAFIGVWILNIIVSVMVYVSEEKRDARVAAMEARGMDAVSGVAKA